MIGQVLLLGYRAAMTALLNAAREVNEAGPFALPRRVSDNSGAKTHAI
jgi:hypothetical protein